MSIRVLFFDVFGTVVDWRSAIIRDGQRLTAQTGMEVDWPSFADAWRAGYGPAMNRVRTGELPWMNIDGLHRTILDTLLSKNGMSAISESDRAWLNRVWHRLDPWPDAIGGMERLRKEFVVVSLSNGNVSLLTNMAKRAGIRWDCVLSAELFGHYKPDPEVYTGAARLMGFEPEQAMMVAAHPGDLEAAAREGFATAFVKRPLEHGPEGPLEPAPGSGATITATDFHDLADQLLTRSGK